MVEQEPEKPLITTAAKSMKGRQYFTPDRYSSNPSVDFSRTKTSTRKRKRSSDDPNEVKAKLSTLRRAEAVQSMLDPKTPSFLKYMLRSHVSSCFWLGLPLHFCKLHLPKKDTMMTLVDENGEEFPIKYLVENPAFSGRWRAFSVAHKLGEGDALVFHLTEPTKLKVYIIKSDGLPEVDGSLLSSHMDERAKEDPAPLDTNVGAEQNPEPSESKGIKPTKKRGRKRKIKENNADEGMKITEKLAPKRQNSSASPNLQGKNQSLLNLAVSNGQSNDSISPSLEGNEQSSLDLNVPTGQTENDLEQVELEVLHGIGSSKATKEFKDVNNLESFTIIVNGFTIDSEISASTHVKYYELCCTQKAFLHEHLVEGINSHLVVGVISEIVNISDAIKSSNLNTSQNEFHSWAKSLEAFEHLGMSVGFLRSRLQKLITIAFESELAQDLKKLKEAMIEQEQIKQAIESTKERLMELEETLESLNTKTTPLKVKAMAHEQTFEAVVNEPW